MAKTTITHSCGHSVQKDIVPSDDEVSRWSGYYRAETEAISAARIVAEARPCASCARPEIIKAPAQTHKPQIKRKSMWLVPASRQFTPSGLPERSGHSDACERGLKNHERCCCSFASKGPSAANLLASSLWRGSTVEYVGFGKTILRHPNGRAVAELIDHNQRQAEEAAWVSKKNREEDAKIDEMNKTSAISSVEFMRKAA